MGDDILAKIGLILAIPFPISTLYPSFLTTVLFIFTVISFPLCHLSYKKSRERKTRLLSMMGMGVDIASLIIVIVFLLMGLV